VTLPLTPAVLEAAYRFLQSTKPFCSWKLPDADDVEFRVAHCKLWHGLFDSGTDGTPRISVSSWSVGRTESLIETMAHEMIHLYLEESGMDDRGEHGERFYKAAATVCRYHGFDPKRF
jgi:hypothetical protein